MLLNIMRQATAILPPEGIAAQDHHTAVIAVARHVVGLVGAPEGIREELMTVSPGPVTFITYTAQNCQFFYIKNMEKIC